MPSMSSSELQQLEFTIQGLESQRALLGDVVTDAALGPLRNRLATLRAGPAVQHHAQVLKHVTILFMDVVGSTSLAQHLDAEEVSAVMDGTLSRGTAVVEAHRGKVLQYAGDSILAAFGADRAAEDDVERAVRCGLALLNLGKALRAEVQAAHGHTSFDFRVGIHSGDVLLGGCQGGVLLWSRDGGFGASPSSFGPEFGSHCFEVCAAAAVKDSAASDRRPARCRVWPSEKVA